MSDTAKIRVQPGRLSRDEIDANGWMVWAPVRYSYDTTNRDLPEPAQTMYPPEPGFVGIEGVEMVLDVTVVPIEHDIGGTCPDPPEVTEEELVGLVARLRAAVVRIAEILEEPGSE